MHMYLAHRNGEKDTISIVIVDIHPCHRNQLQVQSMIFVKSIVSIVQKTPVFKDTLPCVTPIAHHEAETNKENATKSKRHRIGSKKRNITASGISPTPCKITTQSYQAHCFHRSSFSVPSRHCQFFSALVSWSRSSTLPFQHPNCRHFYLDYQGSFR